jgi:hypothetical protein
MKSPLSFTLNVVVPTLVAMTSIAASSARIPYSYSGTITTEEIAAMQSLAWPQSYTAITGRFGFPAQRSDHADWYLRPGGMGAIRIDYNQDNIAVGFAMEGN